MNAITNFNNEKIVFYLQLVSTFWTSWLYQDSSFSATQRSSVPDPFSSVFHYCVHLGLGLRMEHRNNLQTVNTPLSYSSRQGALKACQLPESNWYCKSRTSLWQSCMSHLNPMKWERLWYIGPSLLHYPCPMPLIIIIWVHSACILVSVFNLLHIQSNS